MVTYNENWKAKFGLANDDRQKVNQSAEPFKMEIVASDLSERQKLFVNSGITELAKKYFQKTERPSYEKFLHAYETEKLALLDTMTDAGISLDDAKKLVTDIEKAFEIALPKGSLDENRTPKLGR